MIPKSNQNGAAPAVNNSLRNRQIAGLKQLINLNEPVSSSKAVEPVWKVLIFDRCGQDIISPLLSIKELRELGVTLHLLLDNIRESVADVPAIYFALPSEENVKIICQDLSAGLPRLEDLATAAVQSSQVDTISKVYDQYLNFISLEDDLFTLRRHEPQSGLSFYAINRRDMDEPTMNQIIDSIADGLFSVCVTLGVVPIIRSPKGNAAEQVAERLDKKIRDNLRDTRNNLFTAENVRVGQLSFQRPVLIIVDRGLDLATMLHHSWTYQALVHDVLDFDLNRVIIEEAPTEPGAKPKRKEYDLNVSDNFWMAQKGSPFPVVAEAVQEELEAYRSSEDEIRKLKAAMGLDNGSISEEAVTMVADTTQKLTSTVSSLPELLEKKRLIDMHMNVASAVLEQIKARKLDEYFEMEEKLMNKQMSDTNLMDLIQDPQADSAQDKIRLILQNIICSDLSEEQIKAMTSAVDGDTSSLKFVKLWKSLHKMGAATSYEQYGGGGTKTVGMFPKLLGQGSAFIMEGVKNLVNKKHNLPITRIVDSIMELKSGKSETDDYRYFDPKLLRSDGGGVPRNRTPFNEAIVFVVGGGNYLEYQNLIDYRNKSGGGQSSMASANSNPGASTKKITYGATELVNAQQFLDQLTHLGSEM